MRQAPASRGVLAMVRLATCWACYVLFLCCFLRTFNLATDCYSMLQLSYVKLQYISVYHLCHPPFTSKQNMNIWIRLRSIWLHLPIYVHQSGIPTVYLPSQRSGEPKNEAFMRAVALAHGPSGVEPQCLLW